jgi:Na+:H+ antiporter, NhaA family
MKLNLRSALDLAVSVAMLAAAVIVGWVTIARGSPAGATNPRSGPALLAPNKPVDISGSELKGDAKAVMIIYSDFECPFCGKFSRETLPVIEKDYVTTGRLGLAFRHMPLERIHPSAFRAAVAADCARSQGRFWQMHDRLFQSSARLDQLSILQTAKELGMEGRQFAACTDAAAGGSVDIVRAQASEAVSLGVRTTPSFFFGTRTDSGTVLVRKVVTGAQSMEIFKSAIESVIGASQARGQ